MSARVIRSLILASCWFLTLNLWAQDSTPDAPSVSKPSAAEKQVDGATPVATPATEPSTKSGVPKLLSDFVGDQKYIWTSPARARFADASWLVPLGGIAAGLFVTDRQYSASLSTKSSTLSHYKTVSNAGIAGLVGASAGMYFLSFPTHNEHWRETGWLAGQAAVHSLLVVEAMKYSLGRERPYQGAGAGSFFQGGTSFPSEHAAAAWSIAGVIAHEYPGVLPKLVAYGTAAAIDYSRVHGRQHFPSDVFVGSILGYLVADAIYRRHHEPEIGGEAWEAPSEFIDEDQRRSPGFMGSPYVPLESWVYPAIQRLAAMGYIKTASLGIRPWTRLACAHLVSEASELRDTDAPPEPQKIYDALSEEFAYEFNLMSGDRNVHAQLESVYMRSLGISGTPLTDNFHFGQTVLNDYGRPYQEGFSSASGASGWAAAGPFVIYARGEYESAPSAPSPSRAVLDFISTTDDIPPNAPTTPVAAISRFRLLDAYVAMNLANWQLSYGKQSQWWGASEAGTMLFTNNVEPLTNMFRLDRVTPFRLPWLFGLLGNIRLQFFIGQQSGANFLTTVFSGHPGPTYGQYGKDLHPQPFITGEKFSFHFTENFEFDIGKTAVYGGPSNPLTFTTFYQATLSKKVHGDDLGDGRSGVDFSYRIPKARNWLTFYGDAFTEDEISPLAYPRKSAFSGGLYFARVPAIPKLDLRLEGGTTSPVDYPACSHCFYDNGQYVYGYRNDGRLIGSWIGRAAQGEYATSNYWLSPRNKIGIEFRHRQIDRQYLSTGGAQTDFAVNTQFLLKSGFGLSGSLQYERWMIPLLAPTAQSNVGVSFQFGYWPSRQHQ